MREAFAVLLAVLIPTAAFSQESQAAGTPPPPAIPVAAQAASMQPTTPLRVNPKLRNKQVVVYLRDGRAFTGKLLEIRPDAIILRVQNGWDPQTGKVIYRVESVNLSEVASVERVLPSPHRTPFWVHLALVGVVLVLPLVAVATAKD